MTSDYHDILVEFVAANARFLVVGAHALSVHGVPRATIDLDLWVSPDADNARRVHTALTRFGAPVDAVGITFASLTEPDQVFQIGLPPYRLDILTSISGVVFDAAWAERVEGEVEGVRVPVIGLDSFRKNKRATGRTKDLADLEQLGSH